MASSVLYAPTVEPYTSAFNANGDCVVYFSLSRYNTYEELNINNQASVHATVSSQRTGLSAVNKKNDYANKKYRSTGVILNLTPYKVDGQTNLYYVLISKDNILGNSNSQEPNTWVLGNIYKIQLRLSNVMYTPGTNPSGGAINNESAWMVTNGKNFSEWSTVTVTKAIGEVSIKVGSLNYDSTNPDDDPTVTQKVYYSNVLEIDGTYHCDDPTETLNSYQIQLYDENTKLLIEDSGIHTINKYENVQNFYYKIKRELLQYREYYVIIKIKTINNYEQTFKIRFYASAIQIEDVDLRIKYAGNDIDGSIFTEHWFDEHNIDYVDTVQTKEELDNYDTSTLNEGDIIKVYIDSSKKNTTTYYRFWHGEFSYINTNHEHIAKYITSEDKENEEGCICLKIYDPAPDPQLWNGVVILRRTDEDSNFELWEDLQYFKLEQQLINDLPFFYDFTLEGGKSYKYALQYENIYKDKTGNLITSITKPIKRRYEHSYLLGENEEFLPLKFNTNISNYQLVRQDNLTPTLGSAYPFFTRAAAIKYKQFELSGTISFHEDECEFFLNKADIYGYSHYPTDEARTIDLLYDEDGNQIITQNYRGDMIKQYEEIEFMDYYLEKKFREKVIEFLTNGKPKLYKSTTEPNMIVIITNANFTPNQQLGRLIFDFSCTCTQIDEANIKNYLNYKIIEFNDLLATKLKLDYGMGQIQGTASSGTDLMPLIKNKYDKTGIDQGGYEVQLKKISNIEFKFYSPPSVITVPANQGNYTYYGWGLKIDDNIIYVDHRTPTYVLDDRFELTPESKIEVFNSYAPGYSFDKIDYEVNFIYATYRQVYIPKKIKERRQFTSLDQYIEEVKPGQSIYRDIYYRYYYETEDTLKELTALTDLYIEAPVGTVFELTDSFGGNKMKNKHEISLTGYLRLHDKDITKVVGLKYLGIRELQEDGTYVLNTTKTITPIINYTYVVYTTIYDI